MSLLFEPECNVIIAHLLFRRINIQGSLNHHTYFLTMTCFPLLGAPSNTQALDEGSCSNLQRSQYLSDDIITDMPKYHAVLSNTRSRRGRKPAINVPIYRDRYTLWPFRDPTVKYDLQRWPEDDEVREGAGKDNCIYMDASMFGSSCCCLQVTMQLRNIVEARQLHDHLIPLAPILLALTAATPIWKGFLADTDVRWNSYSAAADDRTAEERGEKVSLCNFIPGLHKFAHAHNSTQPLHGELRRILKSRFASNSAYIAEDTRLLPKYQDPNLVIDLHVKQALREGGMDELLATHFAHLFIREPLCVYAKDVETFDLEDTTHFELIQSTVYPTVRFKPPPAMQSEDTGWRVEFRPIEIQLTDFENAAFAVFMVLLSRTILHFDLNLYMPIAKVDENMEKAHVRDAVLGEKFHFRRHLLPSSPRTKFPNGFSLERTTSKQRSEGLTFGDTSTHSNSPNKAESNKISSNGVSEMTKPLEISTKPVSKQQNTARLRSATNTSFNESPIAHTLEGAHVNNQTEADHEDHQPMTISTIINGDSDPNGFPGLIPFVKAYVSTLNYTPEAAAKIDAYLSLIASRASGASPTTARWMRGFVSAHPEYKRDSVVSEVIAYDMLTAMKDMGERNQRGEEIGMMPKL